ncbi:MAG: flagellar hook-basal body complex protein FliE [Halobacteriales archaeon]|nr:flagellar hook-basal body complex protein FliE [Halobacteriales archaeon]
MRVVGFTGMPGSGKSTAAEVATALGVPVVRMGDCIWEEVKRRGLPLTDASVGSVANEERILHGAGIWAQRTLDKLHALKAERVTIDGVRSLPEVEVFHGGLGKDFVLVAIHASPAVRHQRLLKRGRQDEAADLAALVARDARELAWGIGGVIALADAVIVNEGLSAEQFRGQVTRVLQGR